MKAKRDSDQPFASLVTALDNDNNVDLDEGIQRSAAKAAFRSTTIRDFNDQLKDALNARAEH